MWLMPYKTSSEVKEPSIEELGVLYSQNLLNRGYSLKPASWQRMIVKCDWAKYLVKATNPHQIVNPFNSTLTRFSKDTVDKQFEKMCQEGWESWAISRKDIWNARLRKTFHISASSIISTFNQKNVCLQILTPHFSSCSRPRWATPTTQETTHSRLHLTPTGRRYSKNKKSTHSLSLQDQILVDDVCSKRTTHLEGEIQLNQDLKLNPRWVETLMGLPIGWVMPLCKTPKVIGVNSNSFWQGK